MLRIRFCLLALIVTVEEFTRTFSSVVQETSNSTYARKELEVSQIGIVFTIIAGVMVFTLIVTLLFCYWKRGYWVKNSSIFIDLQNFKTLCTGGWWIKISLKNNNNRLLFELFFWLWDIVKNYVFELCTFFLISNLTLLEPLKLINFIKISA